MEKPTLNLLHRQALADEQLTVEALLEDANNQEATDLASAVNEAEALAAEWEAAEEPDEKEKAQIEKISARLAHKIKDYAERELPDDDGQQPAQEPPVPPAQQTPPVQQVAPQQTDAQTQQQDPPVPPAADGEAAEDGLTYMERRRRRFEQDEV